MPSPAITPLSLGFAILAFAATAATANALEVLQWLKEVTPNRGTGMESEIHCYTLPYGTIGFVSHLLTYYTISMLAAGRSPLLPWKKLKWARFDLWLAMIGLVIGSALTAFTIYRCRQRWQFTLIAVWKATLSVSLGALSIQASHETKRIGKLKKREKARRSLARRWADDNREAEEDGRRDTDLLESVKGKYAKVLWWMVLYVLGIVAGLTGVISLALQSWDNRVVAITTKVFLGFIGGIVGIGLVSMLVAYFVRSRKGKDWRQTDAQPEAEKAAAAAAKQQQGGYQGREQDLEAAVAAAVARELAVEEARRREAAKRAGKYFGGGILLAFLISLFLGGLLAAFYSDWVLAGLAGNLIGVPSRDNSALYYSYFAAKRLPFFSI